MTNSAQDRCWPSHGATKIMKMTAQMRRGVRLDQVHIKELIHVSLRLEHWKHRSRRTQAIAGVVVRWHCAKSNNATTGACSRVCFVLQLQQAVLKGLSQDDC